MPASKPEFIGLDTQYPCADGVTRQRVHMDGAASPLAASVALESISSLLPHYSNSHSRVHNSAQIATEAFTWAHSKILQCIGANEDDYTAIFLGAGCTAAINRVARGLAAARPQRKVVLVSAMEHHANDLPHRQFSNEVHYLPTVGAGKHQGALDLAACETLLKKHQGQVNYLAVSSVSNVTGIVNPISELTQLAHQYDAFILVDGAQSVAHLETTLSRTDKTEEIDFFVFSGHKVYAPASPGVLVAKRSLLDSLSGHDLGGGSVADVSYYDFQLLTEYPEREQSGTPNIVGAVSLARVMESLTEYGYARIAEHDVRLMSELYDALSSMPHITIYGSEQATRVGALPFNHNCIDHGLLAAILNDYYAIAVRNECFCAHPYVSSMLKEQLWELDLSDIEEELQEAYINRKRGMVRCSLSLYNSSADIEQLISALNDIGGKIEEYRKQYQALPDGSYQHKHFSIDWREQLGW